MTVQLDRVAELYHELKRLSRDWSSKISLICTLSILDKGSNIEYNSAVSELQTTEVKRQDLLDMSGLTEALNKNDLVFLTNRGEFDAVIARPGKLAKAMEYGIDKTAKAIRARLKQKSVKPTDHDLAMMRVVKQRGGATLTDIGNDVQRETANIHGRLKLLCKRGFLRREEGESILYYLTKEGLEALKPIC